MCQLLGDKLMLRLSLPHCHPILQTGKQNHVTWAFCFIRSVSSQALAPKVPGNLPPTQRGVYIKVQRDTGWGGEIEKKQQIFMVSLSDVLLCPCLSRDPFALAAQVRVSPATVPGSRVPLSVLIIFARQSIHSCL